MSDSLFSPENVSYDIIVKDEKKKFVCKHLYCGKVFNYESEMKRHITIHSPSRPFKCPYNNCIKTFKRSDALDNHIRCSHKKEATYICPFPDCQMGFAAHGSFRHHVQKNHNKESEEGSSPDQSSSVQITKKIKLEKTLIDHPMKEVDSNNQIETNSETDSFTPSTTSHANNIQWHFPSEDTESIELNKTGLSKKLGQIGEENMYIKEKLMKNEKLIKHMQKQINALLNRFYTFQAELETNAEKPAFPALSEFNNSSFHEEPVKQFKAKEGNLSDLDAFWDAFEFEQNY